jgi:hypothetical protein
MLLFYTFVRILTNYLNMKTIKPALIQCSVLLFILIFANSGYSQLTPASSSGFRLSIENVALTTDKTLEFELYLLDTEPATPFELALIQVGILVNPELYNGGIIKATLVEGKSELLDVQQPMNVLFVQDVNIIKLPSRTLKPVAKDAPAGQRGSIISSKVPGTRICKIMLSNSVAFSKTPAKLSFNFSKIPYPTSVSQYIKGVNTPQECNATNCVVKK